MGGDLEDLMQQPVIHDHADEGLGGEQRVHLPERAFLGAAGDVAGQEFIKHSMPVPEEHVREFVSFECAEEQQAEQRRIGATMDAEAGDEREDPHVLPLVRRFLDGRHELESWLLAAMIAAYSTRLVGKYRNRSASLIPAVFAISRVVVPLKPFWANKEAAAAMMLA